jgi:hypothetical protein
MLEFSAFRRPDAACGSSTARKKARRGGIGYVEPVAGAATAS